MFAKVYAICEHKEEQEIDSHNKVDDNKKNTVEFLHQNGESISKHASKVASMVFAQSCMHREYAYPSILIEADLHAKIHSQEIEIVYDKILNKLGKGFKLRLRRDYRPF